MDRSLRLNLQVRRTLFNRASTNGKRVYREKVFSFNRKGYFTLRTHPAPFLNEVSRSTAPKKQGSLPCPFTAPGSSYLVTRGKRPAVHSHNTPYVNGPAGFCESHFVTLKHKVALCDILGAETSSSGEFSNAPTLFIFGKKPQCG